MSVASTVEYQPRAEFNASTIEQHSLFEGQCIPSCSDRQWWILYTKSRQEKALAHNLRCGNVPHYLPLHRKYSLSRGRRICSIVPLFSGYLFLFGDRDERLYALESNRVARTIAVEQCRQAELWSDLQRIQRLIQSGLPLTLESRIQAGQHVRIKSGRLMGLEGIVTKRRGASRLLVAVDYLQQGASIEVDDFALELI